MGPTLLTSCGPEQQQAMYRCDHAPMAYTDGWTLHHEEVKVGGEHRVRYETREYDDQEDTLCRWARRQMGFDDSWTLHHEQVVPIEYRVRYESRPGPLPMPY